jgi:hypothetical protein
MPRREEGSPEEAEEEAEVETSKEEEAEEATLKTNPGSPVSIVEEEDTRLPFVRVTRSRGEKDRMTGGMIERRVGRPLLWRITNPRKPGWLWPWVPARLLITNPRR